MSVKAAFTELEVTVTESGNDDAVNLGADALGNSSYWQPCGPGIRLSITATVDTNGTDVTVNGKRTLNAPSETIKAQATYASGTRNVLDAQNVEGFAFFQVKSSGTLNDSNIFYALLK